MFRRYILSLFASSLLVMASSAQDIDSFERAINNKNLPDSHRVDSLNIVSRDLLFIDPIRAAQLASEALKTSLKINYPIGQAYAYRILSSIYSNNRLDIIGIEYIQRALIIFQNHDDSAGIANCYVTMGHAFRRSQNRKEEVEYHKKSFEIFSRLKITERIAVSAHNLGESYFLTGEFQKSRELTGYAIKINDSLQNLPVLSNCYKVMGKLEFDMGNLTQAENYFKQVLAISDKLGPASQKIATVESMIELAAIYGQKGQREFQLSFLKEAAVFSEKQLLPEYLQTIYTTLIKYYADEKNQQQVLKYVTEYNRVSESVAAKYLKNQTELGQYAIQVYQFHENEKFDLEKENIIKADRIKTQNLVLLITLIFGVILIVQIIILLKSLREQKKTKQQIKESEEMFRGLVEQSLTGIYIIQDEKFTYINPRFAEIFGYEQNEMLGMKNAGEIVYEPDKGMVRGTVLQRLEGKEVSSNYNFRGVKKDGTVINVEVFGVKAMQSGKPITIGTLLDITDQYNAEEKLRKVNNRLELMNLENSNAVWDWNLETNEIWGNEVHQLYYGLAKTDSAPGENEWRNRIAPEDRERFNNINEVRLNSSGKVFRDEYRFYTENKGWINISASTYIERNEEGKAIRMVGSMLDISERKKAEKELMASEETRRLIMNSALDAIVGMDKNGLLTIWTPQAEKIFGWKEEEVIGKMLSETIIPHKYREAHQRGLAHYMQTGKGPVLSKVIEITALRNDGEEFPVELAIVPVKQGENEFFCAFIRDISERKKAEEQVIKEKELSDSVINSLPGVFYFYDENLKLLRWNKQLETVTGFSSAELSKMSPTELFKGEDSKIIHERSRNVFVNGSGDAEASFTTKDGRRVPYYFTGLRMQYEGKPSMLGIGIDITERKKSEEELKQSEEKYRLLFQSNPLPVFMITLPDIALRDVNEAAIKHYGYSKEEFMQLTLTKLVHKDDLPVVLKDAKELNRNELQKLGVIRHRKKDGSYIHVDIITHDILIEGKQIRLILAMDMTEKLKAEEKLKQTLGDVRNLSAHLQNVREEERIAIAREIHDELGQQLTVLKMDISWLDSKLAVKDDKVQKKMEDLMNTIDNTVKTVRRISSELRPSILDDLGLITAIEWHAREFEKRSGVKTKFKTKIGELKFPVNMSTSIFRIFQESLTNIARHAKASKVAVIIEKKKNELIMTIRDDGGGFDPSAIGIKKTLGILGMRERANIMRGEYFIKSNIGKGTETEVRIPLNGQT